MLIFIIIKIKLKIESLFVCLFLHCNIMIFSSRFRSSPKVKKKNESIKLLSFPRQSFLLSIKNQSKKKFFSNKILTSKKKDSHFIWREDGYMPERKNNKKKIVHGEMEFYHFFFLLLFTPWKPHPNCACPQYLLLLPFFFIGSFFSLLSTASSIK